MPLQKEYQVIGMHCASCASVIEKSLKKLEGVVKVAANYGTESVAVTYEKEKVSETQFEKTLTPLGYSLVSPQESLPSDQNAMVRHAQRKQAALSALKQKLLSAVPLALVSIVLMAWDMLARINWIPELGATGQKLAHLILPLMATYMLFVVGRPYLLGLYRFFRFGKANMDTLIGLGTVSAYLYSVVISVFADTLQPLLNVEATYYDVTIVVITFITLGKYLEMRSKQKTGDAIEKLLRLQAKTALLLVDGKEEEVPLGQVRVGDVLVVRAGARVPVDGTLVTGASYIDESMITGEPVPEAKGAGDKVVAGTINTTQVFQMRAEKVGDETLLAHIIQMVEDAQGSKAPIQALADKIAAVFVPVVLVIAIGSLILWLTLGMGSLGFSQALSFGLVSFVSVLVIACPCALGLATPTAIIVGVGKGAREGILIKDAETLEKLGNVDTLVIDKTGTLTKGKPEVVRLMRQNEKSESEEEFLRVASAVASQSNHPLSRAVVEYAAAQKLQADVATEVEEVPGKGVRAVSYVYGSVALGNIKMLQILGGDTAWAEKQLQEKTAGAGSLLFVVKGRETIGAFLVADAVKKEAKEALQALRKLGIETVMLTGDDKETAQYIAKEVGVRQVVADVLPQEKREQVLILQRQGKKVAMAGDGVNDAPALAQADVGIAMATGTDVAIETAGITLLHGDIRKLVKAIRLSRMTMTGIKQNLFWAFVYNIVGIPLAAGVFYPLFGWLLNPMFAGLAMAFSSVSVVSNSLRLKTKKL